MHLQTQAMLYFKVLNVAFSQQAKCPGYRHCTKAALCSWADLHACHKPSRPSQQGSPIYRTTKPCSFALQRRAPGNQWTPSAGA